MEIALDPDRPPQGVEFRCHFCKWTVQRATVFLEWSGHSYGGPRHQRNERRMTPACDYHGRVPACAAMSSVDRRTTVAVPYEDGKLRMWREFVHRVCQEVLDS